MADGSIRQSVIAAAMPSVMNVPADTPGPVLAAGRKQKDQVTFY